MKTIIAGLALDGEDEPVLARAMQLAERHGARLILVHVIEAMTHGGAEALDADAAKAMLARAAADRLDEVVARGVPGARPECVVAEGRPFEVITDLLHREQADLVVIGPGKPRNMREKLFGSTADRIVRSAAVPVLVVRPGRAEPYRHVVVGIDLSPQSLSASATARALAPEAAIEHLHVVEMPLSFEQALLRAGTSMAEIDRYRRARLVGARDDLKAALAGADASVPPKLRVREGNVRDVMVRRARSRGTDLIALGTHSRDVASQMLLGSVARAVLHSASCDVLVVSC